MTDTLSLEKLAREDHERGCRNEPPWPYLTISHRHVHDVAAQRQMARLPKPEKPQPSPGWDSTPYAPPAVDR